MNRKKTALIAGGGYADIPIIQAAKRLGYHVVTTGNRPAELGHTYSDEYRNTDFSSADDLLQLAESLNASALCSSCNDFAALSCADVAERLGLPGHDPLETAEIIHHKDRFREFALAHDIPCPAASWAGDIESAVAAMGKLRFPLILKPVDLTGGKGISTISEIAQGESAAEIALSVSRLKRIVIEEFHSGTKHGFSAFLRSGKVVFCFTDNEQYYLNPFMVSAASTPSSAPADAIEKLRRATEKIASLLSLRDGIFHVQFIMSDGEPVIIEICRRPPGDLYVRLVEIATGSPYSEWIFRAAAGLDCSEVVHAEPNGFYTRHCIMPCRPGRLKNIVFDPSIENNIVERLMWWEDGQVVENILTTKFGIVFLNYHSLEDMLSKSDSLPELIRVEMY